MAGVSFSTLHSDLRLGLLLVIAALLLNAGASGTFSECRGLRHLRD